MHTYYSSNLSNREERKTWKNFHRITLSDREQSTCELWYRSRCHLVKNQRATAQATTICWQPSRNSQVTKKKNKLYHLLACKKKKKKKFLHRFCLRWTIDLIAFRQDLGSITYNCNSVLPEVNVILPVLVNVPCAFDPEHAVNPSAHDGTDQKISLKSMTLHF